MGGSYVAMLTAFYVDKSTEVIHNFGRADQVDRGAGPAGGVDLPVADPGAGRRRGR
jgi:hypothetical protein